LSSATQEDGDVVIDYHLLKQSFITVARQRGRIGVIGFILTLAALLLFLPQQYESTASVVLQQPSGSGSMAILAAATGASSSSSTRYIGVIKSRTRAQEIVKRLGLQEMFHIRTFHKATMFLQKHVEAKDDTATGLLEITVTLPGPPAISIDHQARRKVVARAAADAANAYVDELRSYYINNDNDRESVLIRHADTASAQARADYEDVLQHIADFEASLGNIDPRSLPTPMSASTVSPAAEEISELYGQLIKVDGELTAMQTSVATQKQLASNTLLNLGSVPAEDPLLQHARNQLNADKGQLASLLVTYGPDHPGVILARNRVSVDERALEAETKGFANSRTTTQEMQAAEIQSLVAQQKLLNKQLQDAAKHFRTNRDLSVVLARLQTELEIRLKVLETTLEESAKIGLENASAESKVSTIDAAEPTDNPMPGGIWLVVLSAIFILFIYFGGVISHYLRQSRNEEGS